MANVITKMCDCCGKTESPNRKVLGIDFKRSDGIRTTGDLCTTCLSRMSRDYGLTDTTRQRRTPFTVTPIDQVKPNG